MSYAWAAFAGDLVTTGDVDDVDDKVSEFTGVVCGEIVAAAFDEEELAIEFCLEGLEGADVGGDVLTDCGVGAAAGLDGEDAVGGEGVVLDEEFLVFAGEDVVGYDGDVV